MKRLLRISLISLTIIVVIFAIWFFIILPKAERTAILNGERNLFPFGEIESNTGGTGSNNQGTSESSDSQDLLGEDTERIPEKKLRQISNVPTNGFAAFSRTNQQIITSSEVDENGVLIEQEQLITTEDQYVRYASIQESNIFETKITPYSTQSKQLVENLIPNTERAIFSKNGDHVIFQFWDEIGGDIESYLGTIEKITFSVEPCPFDLTKPIVLGEEGNHVADIHKFLNRNPQTMIAQQGINSPGNEGNKVIEATITSIKNFQSLNELDIDGAMGTATRTKMQAICNEQQQLLAEKEFEAQDKQYEMVGQFLPENIISADINPESTTLFYLKNQEFDTIGVRENILTGQKETIFQTPLKEIYTQWKSTDTIEITTKPSYLAPTYSYTMNARSGDFHKSLPTNYGMTVLPSPDHSKTLISKIHEGRIVTALIDQNTKTETELNIVTFTDKCTWANNSIDIYCGVPDNLRFADRYPDSWYQGRELYSDDLYHIDTTTGQETLLSDIAYDYSSDIDISNIGIDDKNEYLYFIDKHTEYLWSYRLFEI